MLGLQRVQEVENVSICFVPLMRFEIPVATDFGQGLLFNRHVRHHVLVRRVDVFVAEPYRNGRDIDAGRQHGHGGRMAKDVRRDLFASELWMSGFGPLCDDVEPASRPGSRKVIDVPAGEDVILLLKRATLDVRQQKP